MDVNFSLNMSETGMEGSSFLLFTGWVVLENVKSFTRTNINKPDLPREKRVNRDIFGTSNLQNRSYGVSCDE